MRRDRSLVGVPQTTPYGGGPARACPVAAPKSDRSLSSVRTSTVCPAPFTQLVTVAAWRADTSDATVQGSPVVMPRRASAAARAARSAAVAALLANTADWASNSMTAMAAMTTRASPAARTVPDPRSRPSESSGRLDALRRCTGPATGRHAPAAGRQQTPAAAGSHCPTTGQHAPAAAGWHAPIPVTGFPCCRSGRCRYRSRLRRRYPVPHSELRRVR